MADTKSFFNPELCHNETEVESKFIVHYLLPALGYTPGDWGQEVTFGNLRLDFLAIAYSFFPIRHRFRLVIEAKGPNAALDPYVGQLKKYQTRLRARYGLLTNGKKIRIYEWSEPDFELIMEFSGANIENHIEELRNLIGKDAKPKPKRSNPIKEKRKRIMKTIAIYHNKGGVGKTTTVMNLAAALSLQGKRVLVIDLDAQANTTFAAGLVKFSDELHDDIKESYVYHIILEKNKFPISQVVRKSEFTKPGFDVVPSHIELMDRERKLVEIAPSLTRLVAKLKQVEDSYDVVLIDTPPSLNLYAKIALVSADYLVIPSDLKPFANEGLTNVRKFIEDINDFRDAIAKEPINVLGVLPSKIATADRFKKYTLPKMESAIPSRYGFPLLNSRIFERRAVSAAIERTIPVGEMDIPDPVSIFDHESSSPSAQEFEQLGQEISQLIGL